MARGTSSGRGIDRGRLPAADVSRLTARRGSGRLGLTKRLEALERLWRLPLGSAERLGHLLRVIESHPAAPTAVRDPAEGVEAHVADSLTALELPGVRELAS